MVDRTDPKLKRAAYLVIAYGIVDMLFALSMLARSCDNCTAAQSASQVGFVVGAFVFDGIIIAGAYFGMRGRTGGFITALVVLCVRTAFALLSQNYFTIGITIFFAYWAYVGTATCIVNDRSEAAYNALRKLPSPDTLEPPPPPWVPPKTLPPH